MKCSQCNGVAVFNPAIGPLCLNCTHKYQQIIDNEQASRERAINYLTDQMEMAIGITGISPRFPERKVPVIQNGPVTLNAITIDRSVVGNVNTGYINSLEVSMSSIQHINGDGAENIKIFTEKLLKEKDLSDVKKEEVLQQLNYLVEQLKLPSKNRNMSVIKSVVAGVVNIINFSASLVSLWAPIKLMLGITD